MISSHYLAINNSDLKSANALKQNGTKEMELTCTKYNCVSITVLGALIVISYYPEEPCEVGTIYFTKMRSASGRDFIWI